MISKKLGNTELWHQNRSTSKAPNKQILILSWKELNLTIWHKTRSLSKTQNEKLLITNFWEKSDATKKSYTISEALQRFKLSKIKNYCTEKNPESWILRPNQINFNDSKRAPFKNSWSQKIGWPWTLTPEQKHFEGSK